MDEAFAALAQEDAQAGPSGTSMTFPTLGVHDLQRVSQTILQLFDRNTASRPDLAKQLQSDLQQIQSTPEAWGLISGLAAHEDPNVRFFSAHTAQVKISRDWETLPAELQPSLLALLLSVLANAISPSNPLSYQPANAVVVRKLFGCLASLLLRLPFYHFPHPLLTVLQTISSALAAATSLPPSAPASGYNTPGGPSRNVASPDMERIRHRMRLWSLEWCGICVEEIGRAGISEQKRTALRRHIEGDLPTVMENITSAMRVQPARDMAHQQEQLKEVEAACRCAESWVGYGLAADELSALLPVVYNLLPLPAAASVVIEVLSESLYKFGKGTKILTEPLVAWCLSPQAHSLIADTSGEPSDEVVSFTKLLSALIEHSSEWLVSRIKQAEVQSLLGTVLKITGWEGVGGVEENVSELTLAIYPLVQEAISESEQFSEPHETSPNWQVAKSFFRELVNITRTKVRWPGSGESSGRLGGLDKEDREKFDAWRRDAGEVIVCAYYVLREEMSQSLVEIAQQQVMAGSAWQDIEATLHCIRYSAEAVSLNEETVLPVLFGESILGTLSHRPSQGKGEERLRLTVVCTIQAYEEWFKFHPEHLLSVLSYLVPSLTSTPSISRSAADALKALCDLCRAKLVPHIGAFSELHGKIGDLGVDEQTKVIQAITSVIQALAPGEAISPVEGILRPIVDRINMAVQYFSTDPESAHPALVQAMNSLAASFKGLSPSDDDMFDLSDDDDGDKDLAVAQAREDPRLVNLRQSIEQAIGGVVNVWDGDSEVADSLSSLVKHSTLASSDTLISLSPLPLLTLVTTAGQRAPSALWMSLASTLTSRINSPPSPLTKKKGKSPQEEEAFAAEERERWDIVSDASTRLVGVAGGLIGVEGGMREHPDVVEAWFKFCFAVASRFPGVLLRLSPDVVQAYMSLGVMGLAAQERFSLKSATDFFVALFANTRYPSPLEPAAADLIKHFGPQILRALILSAGSDGPRSVIPNLAELLASLVSRVPGEEMASWLNAIMAEDGFPDPRATTDSKARLKDVILRSRTAKKMREALHEFALIARGLANTTYGNATAV